MLNSKCVTQKLILRGCADFLGLFFWGRVMISDFAEQIGACEGNTRINLRKKQTTTAAQMLVILSLDGTGPFGGLTRNPGISIQMRN